MLRCPLFTVLVKPLQLLSYFPFIPTAGSVGLFNSPTLKPPITVSSPILDRDRWSSIVVIF